MNKRLIKKMIKKRQQFDGAIAAYGNNGGDLLELYDNLDGTLYLKSGHCCVMTIEKIVPIEFITALLSKVMLEHNNDINSIIDSFGWKQSYKDELKKKVRNTY